MKICELIKGLKNQTKVSLAVVFIAGAYLLIKPQRVTADHDQADVAEIEARIQQVNMNQAKLCVLKIDAATSMYYIDKMTKLDVTPYEVWFRNVAEVDIVVDLTKARCEQNGGSVRVYIPEPEVDPDTLNIRPENLKRVGYVQGWRTEKMRTAVDEEVRKGIVMDLKDVVAQNFPAAEARQQTIRVLTHLYNSVGCKKVFVEFEKKNADFN